VRPGPQFLVAVLDGLERRGWLRRQPNPRDRRMHWVQRTEAGDRLFAARCRALTCRGAAVGSAFRGPTAAVGGRHAQIGCDFEMTRDAMKPFGRVVFLTLLAAAGSAFAQAHRAGSSSAVVLPASGRNNQGGSVGTAEQPVAGTTTSVNTLNPSVQISGPYAAARAAPRPCLFPASCRCRRRWNAAWPTTWARSGWRKVFARPTLR